MKATTHAFDAYIQERNKAIAALDIKWARNMIAQNSALAWAFAHDELLLISLHKARLECLAIDDKLRAESAQWLLDQGYKTLTGEIPDPKRLPT